MKIKHFIFFLVLAGCQKTKSTSATSTAKINESQETLAVSNDEKIIKTDTISIDAKEVGSSDYILANLVDQQLDKDSIATATFRLDFYQNKSKTATSKIVIKGFQKGSEWMASYGLTSDNSKNSPFIQIAVGYPACGYAQENYLYYLKNKELQQIHQWVSMTDSGWGNWVEILNSSTEPDTKTFNFYCKTVSFEPDDNGPEDSGILKYSDSTSFSLEGNHWKKKLLSVKDKSYFEKKMTFDEYQNQ